MGSTIGASTKSQKANRKPSRTRRAQTKADPSQAVAKPREHSKEKRKKEGLSRNNHKAIKDNPGEDENSHGSPWDQIQRKTIRIEDLDLDQAHKAPPESTLGPSPGKRLARRRRWQHTGREPITEIADLPKGWDMTEPDLDPKDLDGQIERCYERIEDRIMPQAFIYKLERLLAQKKKVDELASKGPPGLQGRTLERWRTVDKIRRTCSKKGDKDDQLANIHAILEAYASKRLQWDGLVTYWWRGKQLCQPRRFDWDELEVIASHCQGKGGFWCEGITTAGPAPMKPSLAIPIDDGYHFYYNVAFRLPGFTWWDELQVFHDTGCSFTGIYEEDVQQLMGPYRPPQYKVPVVGYASSMTFNGVKMERMIEIEVSILDGRGKRLTHWARVVAFVMDGSNQTAGMGRPDGPFVLQSLYTATAPAEWSTLHIGTSKDSLKLPRVDTSRIYLAPEPACTRNSGMGGRLDWIPRKGESSRNDNYDYEVAPPNDCPNPPWHPKVMPQPAWPVVPRKPFFLKSNETIPETKPSMLTKIPRVKENPDADTNEWYT